MVQSFHEFCLEEHLLRGSWLNAKLLTAIIWYYKCSKIRCTGKMAPPDENLVNAHSQHRQNFSSGPGTSNFWTLVVRPSAALYIIKNNNSLQKWYFSGIYRSEEKYFRFCCVHGKVKVVRNQVYRRSKVVLGVLRVLSTLVVEFSAKKGPILLLKWEKW